MIIDLDELAAEVVNEVDRAESMFPVIASPHEGLAIVQEEFDEFKAEVYRLNLVKGRDTRPQIREELIQLAAMALRMIKDCKLCPLTK